MIFDSRKKRASLQMTTHDVLLAKHGLEYSKASGDEKHFYAKCPDSEEEYKVSIDVRECNSEETCLKLDPPGYGFLVDDKCCAAGKTCACSVGSLFGRQGCSCKYTGPLPNCNTAGR
eukprot:TRINITY_DN3028_c0_g1_i2.p3 TRINITY_DN3028_c0_g1~~TRINITY_DN3028_c0_g1_i2.p3  ORF type:complete len:117 (-),score=23.21 TRINITY_DN3028_c0_g1_i2:258-608(-)